ncbi:bifunctional metallophosphatase/5'-nucleotidase [bacterium]|nr:bifunctional metallophosphatase/5'-nucleotidase [bacterium]
MIQPVNSAPQNTIKTSIFNINDFHGKSINMERAIAVSNAFDNDKKDKDVDKLKFSSGDIMLGEVEPTNKVAMLAQNYMGVMACTLGNHEYDMLEKVGNLIPDMKYRLLACNVNLPPQNPYAKKVEKSYVQKVNGHEYGVIGTSPCDLFSRLKYRKVFDDMHVHNISDTIKDIQKEIDKLKAKNINKIILLSHSGFAYDRKIAEETDGIDIILGGHSHDLIRDVEPDYNLLYSKSGEPVVITQAGRDGKYIDKLDVEFDKNTGILTKVRNSVTGTRGFKRNAPVRYVFEKILGKPHVVGQIESVPPPLENDLIEPNPHANFVVDCIRDELGTDIALLSAANVRGFFESGTLDSRVLDEISPFRNKLCVISYSEKEIVDALKATCKSMVRSNNKPGLLHPSGLKYTVSRSGELKNLTFISKDGKEHQIDVNNPDSNKFYRVGINDYCAQGNDGLKMLKKYDNAEKIYDFDLIKCVEDYFRKNPTPVTIKDDGRVTIVD